MEKKFSTIYLFIFKSDRLGLCGGWSLSLQVLKEAGIHPGQVISPSQDSLAFLTPAGHVGSPISEPACVWTLEGKWSIKTKKK